MVKRLVEVLNPIDHGWCQVLLNPYVDSMWDFPGSVVMAQEILISTMRFSWDV